MKPQHIYIGSDHGGWQVKQELVPWLREQYPAVEDMGAQELNPEDDYPVFAQRVGERVSHAALSLGLTPASAQNPETVGILLCRSGAGMTIVANRFPLVRAVVCRNQDDARLAREHNNANIVVLEGDHVSIEEAKSIISSFLETEFAGGRHARRLEQIADLDRDMIG